MRKNSLIVLLFTLIFVITTPVLVDANVQKFNDVNNNNSHFDGIYTLEKEEIITGYPGNLFKPYQTITRSQTAVLFSRNMGLAVPNNIEKVLSNFKDVGTNHYYAEAIASNYEAGIFTGSNGYFNDGSLSREQMASVLVRAYGLKDNGKSVNARLDNIDPSHRDNVKILFQHEITNQTGDFRPAEHVTRGQFATFLYRTAQNVEGKYQEMDVTFIDVGQGDSTLIQTTGGHNILIDAGTQSAGQRVVSYLKEIDVGKLDLVIGTHPHADHIGGLIPVLNNFQVDKFIDSGMVHTSQTYLNLLGLIDDKNIPFEVPREGQVYSFGDFKMTVLHVDSNVTNANDASISVKGEYGGISFMLTGDAESNVENKMVNSNFDLRSTIYKAGHHGSNTSNTAGFINAVKPGATILSYGQNNSYGHPHADVVNRLKSIGSEIYSTAESGNINVMANGVIYRVDSKPFTGGGTTPSPTPQPDPKPDPEPGVTFPININKATEDQLKELPGIGDTLAARIVEYRNVHGSFKSKAEVMNISGIGQGRYDNIKDLIVL